MGIFDKAKSAATNAAINVTHNALTEEDAKLSAQIEEKRRLLAALNDSLDMAEVGLTNPSFDFMTVDEYKLRLSLCRDRQKDCVRKMLEDAKKTNWTVNDSRAEGRKMVGDISKLLIRAYNGECDELVRKVKTTNVEKSKERAASLAQTIGKLGRVINLSIPDMYVKMKQVEIDISYEYARAKEAEKERIRELKAEEREAKKAAKELEVEKKKLEKEKQHHEQALAEVRNRIASADGEELVALEAKRDELEAVIADTDHAIENVDYRVANQRAGYVYVISNIGSFGEGVYKIGMTRRLEPMDRVRELGDASVPFQFDVHALIFTEDAPGLETALHRKFDDRRVNKVNTRREFFRVSLDEIKACVHENFDGTAEFIVIPEAQQYRESLALVSSESSGR